MFYMTATPEELRAAYRVARGGSYAAGKLANRTPARSRGGRIVARAWGRNLRTVELIERVADKRGISLSPKAV